MHKQGIPDFKYYVGISSLAQVATPRDRVCVLNILGGEFERGDAGGPRLFGRQRGVRHLARSARPGAGDAGGRHPRLQQRPRGAGGGAPVQLRGGLPAALRRA